jgi:4-hydroxyphenylacetate 3-hydroxylase N terminal
MAPRAALREARTTAAEMMSMPQATTEASARPMTGWEYMQSIRDGREIYLYGDRVKDVTTHPAFRNSIRMTARLYDALHDPKASDVLTCPTDTGNGGYTMRFFRAARSARDLVADRDAIAAWARLTYGWMGRSPDYKASFLGTLGANADFYAPFRKMPGAGTASRKRMFCFGIMPSSIRPSIETARRTRSPTCSSTSKKNGITVSSSAARRSSPRVPQSPI